MVCRKCGSSEYGGPICQDQKEKKISKTFRVCYSTVGEGCRIDKTEASRLREDF
jgi:hypothetical protein